MRPALALVALSFARPRVRSPVTMKASERKLTVQIKGTEDTQALLALLRDGGRLKQGKGFNTVHLGATWGQLGKLSRSGGAPERAWLQEHPDALVPLTERTTLMLPKCSPRLLANVAHGMAAVAPADSAAWRELTRCATPAVLGQMKPMELASLGHALALAHRTRLGWRRDRAPLRASPRWPCSRRSGGAACQAAPPLPICPSLVCYLPSRLRPPSAARGGNPRVNLPITLSTCGTWQAVPPLSSPGYEP